MNTVHVPPLAHPQRYPFVWYPLARKRHAIDRTDAEQPIGAPVRTLCGQRHPRTPAGELDWLWRTCQPCWDVACRIVGIERRPESTR